MIPRFTGTVEVLGAVFSREVEDWIRAIPFEDWPQQTRLDDGRLRPAMVNDPTWHDFYLVTDGLVRHICTYVPGAIAAQRMLGVVMPGHSIPPHMDRQAPAWRMRVHVPLVAEPPALFWYGNQPYALLEDFAYMVNTEREHRITNDTPNPRIHFMVDMESP